MINNINRLISYCVDKKIVDKRDCDFVFNQLCYTLKVEPSCGYTYQPTTDHVDLILEQLVANIQFKTTIEKELLKSKLIANAMEMPSAIEARFYQLYRQQPTLATDYLYQYGKDVNYIKELQLQKNISYQVDSKYGLIDITINLSKPEKTTEEISALKKATISNWPSCFLCKEQEGLYGSLTNPDRSNHRLIEIQLSSGKWFFQYSPFSYFNEHAIVLKENHLDMKIDSETFSNLIELVDFLPTYTFGSNADIPIVGGSMLTHDHYQCGNHQFPIFRAENIASRQIGDVTISAINWPLHTIKIESTSKENILEMSNHVLASWTNYVDHAHNIVNFTTVKHNTITPIFRKVDGVYQGYLILRNNLTTDEFPSGIYHVAPERHHIKQENIGLIEAMGLAVLPARLKLELSELATVTDELPDHLIKHQVLYQQIVDFQGDKYQQLLNLAGQVFVDGLEDCGVFKYDLNMFIKFLNNL